MRFVLLTSARSASALRILALAVACLVLQALPGHAQTAAPDVGGAPKDVRVIEDMKVPRWLAETVVRGAQVSGVVPAYKMALADKESSLLPDNKARTSSAERLFQ